MDPDELRWEEHVALWPLLLLSAISRLGSAVREVGGEFELLEDCGLENLIGVSRQRVQER